MRQDLSKNWEILQDVHDTCEQLGLPEHEEESCAILMMLRGGIKKNLSCHLMRRIMWNCALRMWIITAKSG